MFKKDQIFPALVTIAMLLNAVCTWLIIWKVYEQSDRIQTLELHVREIEQRGTEEKEWDVFLLQVFNNEGLTTVAVGDILEFRSVQGAESGYPQKNVFNVPADTNAIIVFTALDTWDFANVILQGGQTHSITRITV